MSRIILVLVAMSFLGVGCNDPVKGDTHCDGNTLVTYGCDPSDSFEMSCDVQPVSTPCGDKMCATIDARHAVCALSADRDYRCPYDSTLKQYCAGTTEALTCQGGYLLDNKTCDTCGANDDGSVECAITTYDVACFRATSACIDGKWRACDASGNATTSSNCGGLDCTSIPADTTNGIPANAICTVDTSTDPRCAAPHFCADNTLYRCVSGYVVYVEVCATSATCIAAGIGRCDGDTASVIGDPMGQPWSES